MNALVNRLQALLGPHAGVLRALGVPIFVIMVLAMMVLPLPAFVLDLLFTFNIAMALMVVMISAHMIKPLYFVKPFDPVAALMLIVITAVILYIFGFVGAIIWNRLHR